MFINLTNPQALETIALALAFGAASAFVAHKKKKNPYTWFFIGFFMGILGLFAIVFLFPKKAKRSKRAPAPKRIEPQIIGPVHKFWYYLDANHQQIGPISYSALSENFKKGTVAPTTYVWNEDLESWKPLKEMIGSTRGNSAARP